MDKVSHAVGEDAGFPGTCAGQHHGCALRMDHRLFLGFVKIV